jgi:RNA polymerase sigma factor (sigma-70 family)
MSDPTPPPPNDPGSRLDNISTHHSLLREAHQPPPECSAAARQALVMRYNRAVRRYLGALLHDEHDADEAAQEVVIKMLRGDFARVNPERGRFRDYLKAAVRNTALSYLNRRRRDPVTLDELPSAEPDRGGEDRWLADWRKTLLGTALQALKAHQRARPGNFSATVLVLLSGHPEEDSEQLAARVSAAVGRPVRADAVRKQVSRARRKLAELLLAEVARTLDEPTPQRVEEELIEVGLMPYVRAFLPGDWKSGAGKGTPARADGP